jgi:hypothetical protein
MSGSPVSAAPVQLYPLAADATPPSRREQTLSNIARDREDLLYVGSAVADVALAVVAARDTLHRAAGTLRWSSLAANVLAVLVAVRSGKRPPIALLVTLTLQLVSAWKRQSHASVARPR